MARAPSPQGGNEPWALTQRRIRIDAVRTASDGPLFRGAQREGAVARLKQLLTAYSLHDAGTGYCQGMADLAAPFVHLYDGDAEVSGQRAGAVQDPGHPLRNQDPRIVAGPSMAMATARFGGNKGASSCFGPR
jgi:hypothetical protein